MEKLGETAASEWTSGKTTNFLQLRPASTRSFSHDSLVRSRSSNLKTSELFPSGRLDFGTSYTRRITESVNSFKSPLKTHFSFKWSQQSFYCSESIYLFMLPRMWCRLIDLVCFIYHPLLFLLLLIFLSSSINFILFSLHSVILPVLPLLILLLYLLLLVCQSTLQTVFKFAI